MSDEFRKLRAIPAARWANVKVTGGTTEELRATAVNLVKEAERVSSIFSGVVTQTQRPVPPEFNDHVHQRA